MAMAVVTSVNQFDSSAQRSQTNVLEEVALRIKRRAQSAERGTYDNTGFYRRQQIGPLEITRVSSRGPKSAPPSAPPRPPNKALLANFEIALTALFKEALCRS